MLAVVPRRPAVLLSVLIALVVAPHALAAAPAVTATATPATGQAPLTVTLAASGDAATYHWDLGDGAAADGASVQHVYAAGLWTATVTATAARRRDRAGARRRPLRVGDARRRLAGDVRQGHALHRLAEAGSGRRARLPRQRRAHVRARDDRRRRRLPHPRARGSARRGGGARGPGGVAAVHAGRASRGDGRLRGPRDARREAERRRPDSPRLGGNAGTHRAPRGRDREDAVGRRPRRAARHARARERRRHRRREGGARLVAGAHDARARPSRTRSSPRERAGPR